MLRRRRASRLKNHHDRYMSSRPRARKNLYSAEPYSCMYCSGLPFWRTTVPIMDVTASMMRRKMARVTEASESYAAARNDFFFSVLIGASSFREFLFTMCLDSEGV